MSKAPSFQFYPGDWLKDPALRLCSPAARGAWIDLLCFMFESEDRGVLKTNGKPWTVADAARAVGCPTKLIRELLDNGVARKRDDGAIYSARMVRDNEHRAENARRVAEHRTRNGPCNASVTPPVMPMSHPSSSSSSSSETKTPLSPPKGGQGKRSRRETHAERMDRLGTLTAADADLGGAA